MEFQEYNPGFGAQDVLGSYVVNYYMATQEQKSEAKFNEQFEAAKKALMESGLDQMVDCYRNIAEHEVEEPIDPLYAGDRTIFTVLKERAVKKFVPKAYYDARDWLANSLETLKNPPKFEGPGPTVSAQIANQWRGQEDKLAVLLLEYMNMRLEKPKTWEKVPGLFNYLSNPNAQKTEECEEAIIGEFVSIGVPFAFCEEIKQSFVVASLTREHNPAIEVPFELQTMSWEKTEEPTAPVIETSLPTEPPSSLSVETLFEPATEKNQWEELFEEPEAGTEAGKTEPEAPPPTTEVKKPNGEEIKSKDKGQEEDPYANLF